MAFGGDDCRADGLGGAGGVDGHPDDGGGGGSDACLGKGEAVLEEGGRYGEVPEHVSLSHRRICRSSTPTERGAVWERSQGVSSQGG